MTDPRDTNETVFTTATRSSGAGQPGATFTTGDIVAERYRIVGLLGRGGMGEVYRAEDLTLEQPVALKFLSFADTHGDRLDRLRGEVRVTRQVSHPNVCRVYDIGVAAGRHFLSMEYVDGEDLASLLRRIGRLPSDKALDIARQLCAGLAAAHDRGVIHRDLKPANVMLDGRGKVRIADFGLAIVSEGATRVEDRAGTPAYMAPEQLDGRELSVQTDIYALGLILYELFTGRPLFTARTMETLRAAQRDLEHLRQSASDVNLDPAVERVVVRCVEYEPSMRPRSALAVAAALPGGDPLAAALASGETPSPQLVAAAGDATTISPKLVGVLTAVAIGGCLWAAIAGAQRSTFALLQPPYSREVLSVKAEEMLRRLRPDTPVSAEASGFEFDTNFTLLYTRTKEFGRAWNTLALITPPPIYFWRRTTTRVLAPLRMPGGNRPSEDDPPRLTPGSTLIRTDLRGRLAYFDARPSNNDAPVPGGALPWERLFQEAGLEPSRFTPAQPEWMPPSWGDARAAWTGTAANRPGTPLRVEAASFRGLPTLFVVAGPWTAKPGEIATDAAPAPSIGFRVVVFGFIGLIVAIVIAAAAVARVNVRSGRADRRGARRLALFVGASQLVATLLVMGHSAGFAELLVLPGAFVFPVLTAAVAWTLYTALEPYIRRVWPSALISWNRAMDGRYRDVRVARDVLVGFAATGILDLLDPFIGRMSNSTPRGFVARAWYAAASSREVVAGLINSLDTALMTAFGVVFFFCVIRMLVRRENIATALFAVVLGIVFGGLAGLSAGNLAFGLIVLINGVVLGWVAVQLVVRFGLIALVAQMLSSSLIGDVVTVSPSAWYATPSFVSLGALVLLTILAGWTCLSAQRTAPVQLVGA